MDIISVEELKARMDAGEKLHIIDVREPEEFEAFNIGAKLIPLGRFQMMDVDELMPLKDEEVIVHCRSGKRSMTACLILDSMGFTNTKNVEGGMLAWQEKFGS
ncbi:rhodanese-like domain-containing protein [Flavihumibacter sp. RY-1]|jgi:rhodanese-related sulfurtransferase|uniref:Rhodanese-like domain-containing protein n=1 Tax=Flavihumibacter fluminis TaxID=2909236 RepID=A0ABS9BGP2_9BACT|nr:rhodanese-like domain-containing protein [Flavihumibacter fluminis]MCF1714009.1 rhodanese-like domain-containing protein [Flavihumibacter fluminis]